jgi:hypothetical protein
MTDEFRADVLKWALRYIALGWAVFRLYTVDDEGRCTCGDRACPNPGKHPFKGTRGFKDATTDEATVRSWCGADGPPFNLAIATSGMTVIDIDMGEGKEGAQTWTALIQEHGEPVTLMARTGGGGMHMFFQYCVDLKTGNNRLGKHVDVKSDGGYVVVAPSRHRSGGIYEWVNWGEKLVPVPPYLMPQKKKTRDRKRKDDSSLEDYTLEDVAAMLKVIPADDRDLWRAVGIILGREFKRSDTAWDLYNAWSDTWGGTKGRNHDATMRQAFYEISQQAGEKELSLGTIIKLAKDNGWVPKCIAELNQLYAVVWMGGDCVILREHTAPDSGLPDVSFATKGAVKLFHADAPAVGKMNRVEYWLKHPAHRKYDGLIFQPGPKPCPAELYNLYRGFAVEPKEGNCDLYLTHLKENIACGNEEYFLYLMAWMANIVQTPGTRPGVAIVLRGKQGTGKGVFAKGLGHLFTPHFAHITNSHQLVGRFNALLKKAVLVFADEAFWAGDKQAEGTLNALITEETHNIEPKGIDPFSVKNFMHLIVASNHAWVIPAASEARRWLMLDVSETHLQDHAYFKAIDTQMKNGGSAALLYELLEYDGSRVDLWTVPKTEALDDQKVHSMTQVERFWFGCLKIGSQVGGRWDQYAECQIGSGEWDTVVSASALYDTYVERSKQAGVTRRAMEMDLADALKRMAPRVGHERVWSGGRQVRGWTFPPLKECREAFDQYMKWTYPWPDDLDDLRKEVVSPQSSS